LLLSAIQKVRMAAARVSSANNLKQLGLALHAAHDANGHIPPLIGAYPGPGWMYGTRAPGRTIGNAFFYLLPHLEQDAIYRNLTPVVYPAYPHLNGAVALNKHDYPLKVMMNPGDPSLPPDGIHPGWKNAVGSYAANFRVFGIRDALLLGQYHWTGQMRAFPHGFPDGMTQTVAFAEKYARCHAAGYPNANFWSSWSWSHGNVTFNAGPGTAFLGTGPFTGTEPTFQVRPQWDHGGDCNPLLAQTPFAAMQVCLADGSVRGVSASVPPATWYRLLDPVDGNVLGPEW
jgi:hypothetical protein